MHEGHADFNNVGTTKARQPLLGRAISVTGSQRGHTSSPSRSMTLSWMIGVGSTVVDQLK